tara:strand:+ start:2722 stop:2898 length:177 start_codon:yes stop_codon:yes gene_type:complete
MSDLTKRLRENVHPTVSGYQDSEAVLEAADELERLTTEVERLREEAEMWKEAYTSTQP